MLRCIVFILCSFAMLGQSEGQNGDYRVVYIAQGLVRGRIDPEGGIYNFYNIPYATAPTGVDKFKAPLPPPVWTWQTFDAEDRGIVCPQPFASINMREDCLVTNVFVPDTVETNLPVLVVIHGGAYQFGSGSGEQFKDFARSRKVIVVTFNYRLGVHGFLCLGTEGAPGNVGLKDQVALLRWVNINIASFGGNPEDVTLAACSAGSGSVDFQTLSSITKGLFNKAIMESGVTTGAVGVQIDAINNAKNYAKLLNFSDVDDLNKLEEFYRTATIEQLLSQHGAITNNQNVAILFAPCVDRDIGQERVVMDAPMNVMTKGNYNKIPLLYSFTNMEGAMRLPFFDTWKVEMNEKFSDFLSAELHFDSVDVKERVAQKVKQFYFGKDPVSEDNILSYIQYFTDVLFAYPMLRSLSTRVKALGDTIHLFEYSFFDRDTPSFPHTDVRGANHCHQFIAVMDQDVTDRTEEYKQMKETLRDYWHNFILTGSPSSSTSALPPWPPANVQRSPHMSIGPTIELKDQILGDRAAFWDAIYEKHYRGPVMPSDPNTTTQFTPELSTSEPPTSSPLPPTTELDDSRGVSIFISNVTFLGVLLSLYLNLL